MSTQCAHWSSKLNIVDFESDKVYNYVYRYALSALNGKLNREWAAPVIRIVIRDVIPLHSYILIQKLSNVNTQLNTSYFI